MTTEERVVHILAGEARCDCCGQWSQPRSDNLCIHPDYQDAQLCTRCEGVFARKSARWRRRQARRMWGVTQ